GARRAPRVSDSGSGLVMRSSCARRTVIISNRCGGWSPRARPAAAVQQRGAEGPGDRSEVENMTDLVYFSSVSGNTHRFVQKLDRPALRIPLYPREEPLVVSEPYVLLVPTYGG